MIPSITGKTILRGAGTCSSSLLSSTPRRGRHLFQTPIILKKNNMKDKINYENFLSPSAKLRKPSLIRELTGQFSTAEPGTLFLAGGLPNADLFPFSKLSVKLTTGEELNLDENELKAALQYQPTKGYIPLNIELRKFVQHFFNPPKMQETDIIVTVGSQSALSTVLQTMFSPGDAIIIPVPVYANVLSMLDPYHPVYIGVPEDKYGMKPDVLEEMLDNLKQKGGSMPKILYINPTGTNPSGVVIPLERKRRIYDIARKHNLLILEDDPYYFLHFQDKDPETFLSLDVDGRVIRFDSFSKILSSGLRIGFATGPKELIRAMELFFGSDVLHASSISQVLVNGILTRWGISGFIKHTDRVKALYKRRRDLMVAAAEKHLKGLAEWNSPEGGMFLWMKVLNLMDSYSMIVDRGVGQKVILLPGRVFMARREDPCPFLRASFSIIPEEQIEEAMRRLASLIKKEHEQMLQ